MGKCKYICIKRTDPIIAGVYMMDIVVHTLVLMKTCEAKCT